MWGFLLISNSVSRESRINIKMFSLQESNLALGNVVNVGGFPPKVSGNCHHLLFLADEESLSILNFSQLNQTA